MLDGTCGDTEDAPPFCSRALSSAPPAEGPRFELNGVTRVTPWEANWGGHSTDLVVPSPFYYGLKTPSLLNLRK
jgi:hypothetical protein